MNIIILSIIGFSICLIATWVKTNFEKEYLNKVEPIKWRVLDILIILLGLIPVFGIIVGLKIVFSIFYGDMNESYMLRLRKDSFMAKEIK